MWFVSFVSWKLCYSAGPDWPLVCYRVQQMPLDSARSAGSNVNAYLLMEDTVLGFGMRVNSERWVDGSCIIAFVTTVELARKVGM